MNVVCSRSAPRVGWTWPLAVVLAIGWLVGGCGPAGFGKSKPPAGSGDPSTAIRDTWPPRAVWVVRETYDSPEQIAELMEQIRQAGLNTVIFQVRGNGTAWYRSEIEPFALEYEAGDPGFDPLTVACAEAHRRGLTLHAWANVMPAWKDPAGQGNPPTDPNQLYNAHPEWFLYDQHQQREPIPDAFYVNLNPCLPEVRRYLVRVFEEIVRNYPVDGLHLDYIRFVMDMVPEGSAYPYDAKTLALYNQATGKRPQDDAATWQQWRTDQITQLIRDIRRMMRKTRPRAILSVAAAPDLERARGRYLQDAPAWINGHLVDAVFVMNYTKDTDLFRQRYKVWRRTVGNRPLIAGLGVYMHDDPEVTLDQLKLAEQWGDGFCLFSDKVLFKPQDHERLDAIQPFLLEMRTRARARPDRGPITGGPTKGRRPVGVAP